MGWAQVRGDKGGGMCKQVSVYAGEGSPTPKVKLVVDESPEFRTKKK